MERQKAINSALIGIKENFNIVMEEINYLKRHAINKEDANAMQGAFNFALQICNDLKELHDIFN